jgi:hypothetical protein
MSTLPIVRAFHLAFLALSFAGLASAETSKAAGEDESLKADLASVQGTWERGLVDEHGKATGRVVKWTRGNTETVTYYATDGKVLRSQSAKFRLERSGPVWVFSYAVEVTDGVDKGMKYTSAYISKVVGNTWYEIHGALIGQEEESPRMLIWKRARET